jgi:hypothetical protein
VKLALLILRDLLTFGALLTTALVLIAVLAPAVGH